MFDRVKELVGWLLKPEIRTSPPWLDHHHHPSAIDTARPQSELTVLKVNSHEPNELILSTELLLESPQYNRMSVPKWE